MCVKDEENGCFNIEILRMIVTSLFRKKFLWHKIALKIALFYILPEKVVSCWNKSPNTGVADVSENWETHFLSEYDFLRFGA